MYPEDARKLTPDALEALRRRAVAAVESGTSRAEVARVLGVSRQTISTWHRDYRTRGEEALRGRRRGRRPGDHLALTYAQQLWTIRAVTTGGPEEVGLRYWLWTNQVIAELINSRLRVPLSVTTVRNYLIRWGVLNESVSLGRRPGTARVTRPHGAGGETLWTHHALTNRLTGPPPPDAAASGTPVLGARTSVLYAVSPRGTVLFIPTADPFDGVRLAEFFTRLVRQRGRRVTIVQGWRPTTRAEAVTAWAVRHADRVSLRFAADGPSVDEPPESDDRVRCAVPAPRGRRRRGASPVGAE
ncbi:helix-turn-helix domain-containing protein [Saccharothrix syringae]|nr:helix-turn-helix domain-containing protein [Saccharothrix syringae]